MILLVGPEGGLDFGKTSFFFRANIEDLLDYLIRGNSMELDEFDFGVGPEPAFRCCGCHRFTPLITGSVDHVIPRTSLLSKTKIVSRVGEIYDSVQYKWGYIYIRREGKVHLINAAESNIDIYDYELESNDEGEVFMQVAGMEFPLEKVLENDMQNLQLMCHYCNSRKGNR